MISYPSSVTKTVCSHCADHFPSYVLTVHLSDLEKFHEDPQIPHFRQTRLLTKLEEGMTFTIEPMVNLGAYNVIVSKSDKWTVRTKDGKWSAQFEHTLLVTSKGYEILTLPV